MNCVHCGTALGSADRCPSCGAPRTDTRPAPPSFQSIPRWVPIAALVTTVMFVGLSFFFGGVGGILSLVGIYLNPESNPNRLRRAIAKAAEEPPIAAPSPHDGFAAIKARGELRVAADADAPPFLSGAPGAWEGFEYGIMSAIAAEIGVPVRVVDTAFEALPAAITSGTVDLAIGQVSPGTAWEGVGYSVSYLQYSLCLVTPTRARVTRLPELAGKRIGLWEDPVARRVTDAGVGGPYIQLAYVDDGYFQDLAAGKLDVVVYDCPLARHELRRFPTLAIADDALNLSTYNVAMRADDTALRAEVNRVLEGLGNQGLLARIEERWLGTRPPSDGYDAGGERVVVVRRGETLATIAARELGDASRAAELHARNKDLIGDDPEAIYAGLRLRIGQ